MIDKYIKEYGFYIIVPFVLFVVFFGGFYIGKYAKAAPSLEAIERESITSEVTSTKTETVTSEAEQDTTPQYIEMTVTATAYCPCKTCSDNYGTMTATGVTAQAGRTIAVDPSVIPYGTHVIINGHTYIAEDCGGAIKGKEIDVYFDTHAEATEFGRQVMTVYVLK